jgi:hypothetical protein
MIDPELEKKLAEQMHATMIPARDQTVAYAVYSLQIQLVVSLNRNETHVLTINRLGDRFGIEEVVLVRPTKSLTRLLTDELVDGGYEGGDTFVP